MKKFLLVFSFYFIAIFSQIPSNPKSRTKLKANPNSDWLRVVPFYEIWYFLLNQEKNASNSKSVVFYHEIIIWSSFGFTRLVQRMNNLDKMIQKLTKTKKIPDIFVPNPNHSSQIILQNPENRCVKFTKNWKKSKKKSNQKRNHGQSKLLSKLRPYQVHYHFSNTFSLSMVWEWYPF